MGVDPAYVRNAARNPIGAGSAIQNDVCTSENCHVNTGSHQRNAAKTSACPARNRAAASTARWRRQARSAITVSTCAPMMNAA